MSKIPTTFTVYAIRGRRSHFRYFIFLKIFEKSTLKNRLNFFLHPQTPTLLPVPIITRFHDNNDKPDDSGPDMHTAHPLPCSLPATDFARCATIGLVPGQPVSRVCMLGSSAPNWDMHVRQ
jgi:hypothetical protein